MLATVVALIDKARLRSLAPLGKEGSGRVEEEDVCARSRCHDAGGDADGSKPGFRPRRMSGVRYRGSRQCPERDLARRDPRASPDSPGRRSGPLLPRGPLPLARKPLSHRVVIGPIASRPGVSMNPGPSLLPLFTRLRGRVILRSLPTSNTLVTIK